MKTKLFDILALLLLALFFAPYVLKVQEFDLAVILLIGLAMPLYDFMFHKDEKK